MMFASLAILLRVYRYLFGALNVLFMGRVLHCWLLRRSLYFNRYVYHWAWYSAPESLSHVFAALQRQWRFMLLANALRVPTI